MQHYTLSFLSVVLIFSVTGSTAIENELLKAGLKQFSQFTPPIWVEPDTSRIQFAQIEPAGTPLDGELTITIHVAKLSDRRIEISGTTNLPVDTPLLLSVLERGPGGFYGMKTCTVLGDGFYKCEVLGNRELKEGLYVVRFLRADASTSTVTVLTEKEFTISGAKTKKWYEGGTLHKKSALEWQIASDSDKLATCSHFILYMWKNDGLKSSIIENFSTLDAIRPYAQELVDFLDAAFELEPDPEQNHRLFVNQTVAGSASIGMIMMEWTK